MHNRQGCGMQIKTVWDGFCTKICSMSVKKGWSQPARKALALTCVPKASCARWLGWRESQKRGKLSWVLINPHELPHHATNNLLFVKFLCGRNLLIAVIFRSGKRRQVFKDYFCSQSVPSEYGVPKTPPAVSPMGSECQTFPLLMSSVPSPQLWVATSRFSHQLYQVFTISEVWRLMLFAWRTHTPHRCLEISFFYMKPHLIHFFM